MKPTDSRQIIMQQTIFSITRTITFTLIVFSSFFLYHQWLAMSNRFNGSYQKRVYSIFSGKVLSHKNMLDEKEYSLLLLPGDVNMPEVMYKSLLLMKNVYKTGNLNFTSARQKCSQQIVCKALDILIKAYGKKIIDLDNAIFQLNILRQRYLARYPRPTACEGCFIYNFHRLLTPGNICKNCEKTIYLLILITTTAKALDARNALRETWLQYAEQNCGIIRYLFLIGAGCSPDLMNKLKEENNKYGDILVEDYTDSYYNLSYKVYGGLRWAARNCPQAKFVSRSADDIYMNIPKIMEYLIINEWNMEDTVIGTCHREASVDREKWSRHYQSKNDYVARRYGPFCVGKTNIMPIAAAMKIVKVGPDIPWFNLEDHWVGFAGEKARLKVRSVKGFNIEYYPHENVHLYSIWRKKKGVCTFYKFWYSLHRMRPSNIRAVYYHCIKNISNFTTHISN